MAGPYTIATPIAGQKISVAAFGTPVKAAIDDLHLRVAALETGQQSIIARARRTTSSSATTTTEIGVLRLDNIPVRAGKIYQIQTGPLNLDASIDGTIATGRLRVAYAVGTGTAATIASGKIGTYRAFQDDQSQSNVSTFNGFYYATADGYISVLLSIIRDGGTGTVTAFASAADPLDFIVQFGGNDPGDTGVVL